MVAARRAKAAGAKLQQDGITPDNIYAIHKEVHHLRRSSDQGAGSVDSWPCWSCGAECCWAHARKLWQ